MGDNLHEPRALLQHRSDSHAMDFFGLPLAGVDAERLGKPKQRFEVVTRLHELHAAEHVELRDLLAVFLALVRGAAPLREHARQSRDEYENEAGRERCDYRLVPAPTSSTLCA